MYIILYTRIADDREFNVTVNGSVTSITLTGLEVLLEYRLVILTVNSDGDTAGSSAITFSTYGKFEPVKFHCLFTLCY